MKYAESNVKYGQVAIKPFIHMRLANAIRLYNLNEIKNIFGARGLRINSTFSDYKGTVLCPKNLRMIVYSSKISNDNISEAYSIDD
ncbi:hypothetical protein PV797_19265 [Clostridiaceae bacterium M8S5]|nr:hypothetical protein PV797_19265 [Clostridiaceae bacterium M8S5]